VGYELFFISIIERGSEDGDLHCSIESYSVSMEIFPCFLLYYLWLRSEFYSLILFFEFSYSVQSEQALFGLIFLRSGPFSP
jgi:hypothetical protein